MLWRMLKADLLGDPRSSVTSSRFLAERLAITSRLFPASMVGISGVVLLLFALFPHMRDNPIAIGVGVAIVALAVFRLVGWRSLKEEAVSAAYTRMRRLAIESMAMATLCGCLLADLIDDATTAQLVLLLAAQIGIIAAGAQLLAATPAAALPYIVFAQMPLVVKALASPDSMPTGFVPMAVIFSILLIRTTGVQCRLILDLIAKEHEARSSEEKVALLLREFETNGTEWLFELEPDGKVRAPSARFTAALGRTPTEIQAIDWFPYLRAHYAGDPYRLTLIHEVAGIIEAGEPLHGHLLPVPINGEDRWLSISGHGRVNVEGEPNGYIGISSDVTEAQRSREELHRAARIDMLTGLPNRRAVMEELTAALALSAAGGNGTALLFIDLDRFKPVNDTFGHDFGDRLLRQIASRLRFAVDGDARDAIVGRLGGDEFAIVLSGLSDITGVANRIGHAVVDALSHPFYVSHTPVRIGASVGLAVSPMDGEDADALFGAADRALYAAKRNGRGQAIAHGPELKHHADFRAQMAVDLRDALDRGEFQLQYQPIVDLEQATPVGFEALLRWQHPRMGIIPPSTFVPVAEETGLISAIGDWVIRTGCAFAGQLPTSIGVSLNMSPVQLMHPNLPDDVARALATHGISPGRIDFEVTENVVMENNRMVVQAMNRLRALGLGMTLDDFGTGYSSFGYLRHHEFNRLKIDRSFVHNVGTDERSASIIRAIVVMADTLAIEVTAEGVETAEEAATLARLGCRKAQGYYFHRPMTADRALALVARSLVSSPAAAD